MDKKKKPFKMIALLSSSIAFISAIFGIISFITGKNLPNFFSTLKTDLQKINESYSEINTDNINRNERSDWIIITKVEYLSSDITEGLMYFRFKIQYCLESHENAIITLGGNYLEDTSWTGFDSNYDIPIEKGAGYVKVEIPLRVNILEDLSIKAYLQPDNYYTLDNWYPITESYEYLTIDSFIQNYN